MRKPQGRSRSGAASEERAAALLLLLAVVGRRLLDFPDEREEDLADVDLGLGRRLKERAAERLGELLALVPRNVALVLEIALVADEDHGHRDRVLDAEDLLAQVAHGRELLRSGRVRISSRHCSPSTSTCLR